MLLITSVFSSFIVTRFPVLFIIVYTFLVFSFLINVLVEASLQPSSSHPYTTILINTFKKNHKTLSMYTERDFFKGKTGGCHTYFTYSYCLILPPFAEEQTEMLQPWQTVFLLISPVWEPLLLLVLSVLAQGGRRRAE